ncbi:MAG: class I SAM-dependent methyltransferase [Hyalangium sp.]|uniref:class I SAM-dependent methyltransferase n=1 Tax=Hyalangium sp. TaxID=2028555 RepID=UPI003899C56E
MKAGRASQTASMVAFMRALADVGITSVPEFSDPTARHLLAPPWSTFFRLAERRLQKASPKARQGAAVGVDVLALRTVLIDAYLREALARGIRQVVILGAGLDGRAYRIQELGETTVFEVDHPDTQAFKRSRLEPLTPTAKQLRFVSVDFEKDSLDRALEQAGQLTGEPTFFIWEGVVMYLTDQAVRGTLRVVASRSAPGSSILINYSVPGTRPGPLSLLLRLWREPQIGERTPEEMKALVEEVGFEAAEDSGMPEWAQRFGAKPPPPRIERRFRIVIANARGTHTAR